MFIDSHAHIYLEQFDKDRDEIIELCLESGVELICMPNIDKDSITRMKETAERYPQCLPMMGLHPCSVKDDYKEQLQQVEVELAGDIPYIAVGEVGIDLYWDKGTYDIQKKAFQYQIELAKDHNLPVVIHSRDSLDETIKIIEHYQDGSLSGVFHCFNGTVDQGKAISDIGFMMGIGGVITFKNAGVDNTVAQLSLKDMILETDAPYLTPAPHRGKRNRPDYIPIIADKLSDLFEMETPEVAKITSHNCKNLFII